MSPRCEPELEDSKPIFLQDTLAQDDASPYQLTTEEILMGQYSCKEKQKQKNFKQVYSPFDGNVAVSRACDRHAADAYLIPRYGMVFFSQSSSNAVSYGVHTTPCAIACINICAHVKGPEVHVKVLWLMETLKPPACTVGWVARLLWLAFPGESKLKFPWLVSWCF